jgi:hypothetical protein
MSELRKAERRDIGPFKVSSGLLPAMDGLELGADLAASLGPAWGKLMEIGLTLGDDDDVDIGGLIEILFKHLTKDAIKKISLPLLAATRVSVNGKFHALTTREDVDFVFTGHSWELFQTMQFAAEVNFRDFFVRASAVVKARLSAAAALANASKSESTEEPATAGQHTASG